MPLLAEALVEEWLNRKGFFTIRGLKQGVDEIDLLAIRHRADGASEAWHVESAVSFRPIGYISPLTGELAAKLGKKRSSVFRRTEQQICECVASWVAKKFRAKKKIAAREALWPKADWRFVLVHGAVRYPDELKLIASQGVTIVPLSEALAELCSGITPAYTGSAGGDLADLIAFYAKHASAGPH